MLHHTSHIDQRAARHGSNRTETRNIIDTMEVLGCKLVNRGTQHSKHKRWMANWLKGVVSERTPPWGKIHPFADMPDRQAPSSSSLPFLSLSYRQTWEKVGTWWQRRVVRNNNITRANLRFMGGSPFEFSLYFKVKVLTLLENWWLQHFVKHISHFIRAM